MSSVGVAMWEYPLLSFLQKIKTHLVERLFYLHHKTSGSILYSNRELYYSCYWYFLLRKSLLGFERPLTCLWLIKINSTPNSSVWEPCHKYFLLHFPTLRRLPDITNTIDSGQKVNETICNLNTNHFPGKSQYSSTLATESSTTVNRSRVRVIRIILVDTYLFNRRPIGTGFL